MIYTKNELFLVYFVIDRILINCAEQLIDLKMSNVMYCYYYGLSPVFMIQRSLDFDAILSDKILSQLYMALHYTYETNS